MIDMQAIFGDASYKLTSSFGYRSPLGLPSGASLFHQGVDWSVALGTKIGSFADGTVLDAGYNSAKGNYVTVKHSDGLISEYGHLDAISVNAGQSILKGGVLGSAGNTGISSGTHLDFRIKKDGVYIDPLKYTGTAGDGSSSSIDVSGVTDIIKNNWYFIAGGLLLVAVFTK